MRKAFLHLAAVLALSLAFLLPDAECFSSSSTDAVQAALATRIADILPEDEEFMMESETSRRILAGGGGAITPRAQNPTREFCRTHSTYEGCDGKQTGIKDRRKCDVENNCARQA